MNRVVFFPAELKFLRFKNKEKIIVQISVRFFLFIVQFLMLVKFNFNIFIFCAVCLPQVGSVHTPSSLAAVIGLSNNDVISLRSLRSSRCVRCVGWKPRLTVLPSLTHVPRLRSDVPANQILRNCILYQDEGWWPALAGVETCQWSTTHHLDPPDLSWHGCYSDW